MVVISSPNSLINLNNEKVIKSSVTSPCSSVSVATATTTLCTTTDATTTATTTAITFILLLLLLLLLLILSCKTINFLEVESCVLI